MYKNKSFKIELNAANLTQKSCLSWGIVILSCEKTKLDSNLHQQSYLMDNYLKDGGLSEHT